MRTRTVLLASAVAALALGVVWSQAGADGYGPIGGHTQTIEHLTAPDGGLVRAAGSAAGVQLVESRGGTVQLVAPDGGQLGAATSSPLMVGLVDDLGTQRGSMTAPMGSLVVGVNENASAYTAAVVDDESRLLVKDYVKPTINSTACVLCATPGDGGTIAPSVGADYAIKVIDQSGSPVRVANSVACVEFGASGVGTMVAPGTYRFTASAAPDGGTPHLTCCAQTATVSPSGPWLCLEPIE